MEEQHNDLLLDSPLGEPGDLVGGGVTSKVTRRYQVTFDGVPVPTTMVQEGVLRCQAPGEWSLFTVRSRLEDCLVKVTHAARTDTYKNTIK